MSKKAGITSSIVQVANGTRMLYHNHSNPLKNFSVNGAIASFNLSNAFDKFVKSMSFKGANNSLILFAILTAPLSSDSVNPPTSIASLNDASPMPPMLPTPPPLEPPEPSDVSSLLFSTLISSTPANARLIFFAACVAASPVLAMLSAVPDALEPILAMLVLAFDTTSGISNPNTLSTCAILLKNRVRALSANSI